MLQLSLFSTEQTWTQTRWEKVVVFVVVFVVVVVIVIVIVVVVVVFSMLPT